MPIMIDQDTIANALDAAGRRRAERRRFLQLAGGASVAAGGLALLSACGGGDSPSPTPSPSPSPTPTATSTTNPDGDALNFALQLEYLQAQFYSFAATGAGLPANLLTGTGTQGAVTGGRAVSFGDPIIASYAREIARDEAAHVAYLRAQLGAVAVAQPAINISGAADGAFAAAAVNFKLVGAGATFDPYASDENFLLAAFMFEDVVVTSYKGLVPLIATASYASAAAGILGAKAYNAGLIRTELAAKGLFAQAKLISDGRDALDGASKLDQDIGTAAAPNIVPTDSNGIVYSRLPTQVLNILYLNKLAVTSGGFFPAGLNGNLKTSAAN